MQEIHIDETRSIHCNPMWEQGPPQVFLNLLKVKVNNLNSVLLDMLGSIWKQVWYIQMAHCQNQLQSQDKVILLVL